MKKVKVEIAMPFVEVGKEFNLDAGGGVDIDIKGCRAFYCWASEDIELLVNVSGWNTMIFRNNSFYS